MNAYPEYKESGIDWLGSIPESWYTARLKYYISITNGRDPITNGEIPVYGSGGSSFKTCGEFKEGPTVLLGRKGTINNPRWIQNRYWNVDTAFDTHSLNGFNLRFFYYLSKIFDYDMYQTNTAVPSMTQSDYGNITIPIPSKSEQETIAAYLDEKTGKIDELIAEKTKQVKDLRSYRTSVITEAVTHGLNPNAPLRQSGIDWLGEIPEHWNIIKTNYVFNNIGSGTTPDTNNDDYYSESGINWLQTGDLNDGNIECTSKHITDLAVTEKGLKRYPINSLVIAMYGATIAKLGILKIETTVNQACCVLTPSVTIENKYAFYVFHAGKNALIKLASGGGQPNISQAVIKEFRIPVPPISEQQEIAAYLDEKTAKIDKLISELNTQLAELAEYKQAVISEAVTGKVDVRDYKSSL
jgi:type I restriction enzyme S subunit